MMMVPALMTSHHSHHHHHQHHHPTNPTNADPNTTTPFQLPQLPPSNHNRNSSTSSFIFNDHHPNNNNNHPAAAAACYFMDNNNSNHDGSSSSSSSVKAKIMAHPHYHRLLASYINCQKVKIKPRQCPSISAFNSPTNVGVRTTTLPPFLLLFLVKGKKNTNLDTLCLKVIDN